MGTQARRTWVIVALAGLASVAGAQDRTPERTDWKSRWISERNRIIETVPDLVYDPTSVLVKFKDGVGDAEAALTNEMVGADTIETWEILPGVQHVRVGAGVEETLALYGLMDNVEYAEPDYIIRANVTPNDTYYSLLYGMHNTGQTINGVVGVADRDIDAPEAWDITTGSTGVTVAIIDTGIRKTHEDLAANIWSNPGEIAGNNIDDDGNGYKDDTWGWNFYSNTNNPSDNNGHGSHTAGTVGAKGNNGKGVAGVAWNCKLAALKFLGATGSGSTSGAISAINYCRVKGIRVSNNSYSSSAYSSSFYTAINNAKSAGHVMVCAAGNSGANADSAPEYPGAYNLDNIISVAAVDNRGNLASFSNYGATSVDLAAPGVDIASCWRNSDTYYVYSSGTSMASPHVAGVAALVLSRYPTWTYTQVRSRILGSVTTYANLSGKCATGGVVNANGAVQ